MSNKKGICISNANFRSFRILLLLFSLLSANLISANLPSGKAGEFAVQQNLKLSGNIVDEQGAPLPGVTVVVKGTTTGTVTDMNGKFEIKVPDGGTIVVSFIGLTTQQIVVNNSMTQLKVVMKEEISAIGEVVVVGYGTQKKETITGSLSTVSSEDLVQQPVSNISQALAGRLPGLIANESGGRPGKDASTIKIRGIGTLDAGAGSNPLILIDGVERDQSALNFLDPNEIESISILKDASSTAVFGVRGANGVILVTTKRGQLGPAKVEYKASMAVMLPSFKLNLIDSYQQTGLLNEYLGFTENTTNPSAPYPASLRDKFKAVIDGNPINPNDPFFYPSTDYADFMLKDYAMQQQHNFTIRGGTERLKYFASLGYFDQGGLFEDINPDLDETTSYKRYNYRTNIDVNLTKTTLGKINIGGSFNKNIGLGQPGSEPASSFYWNLLVHSSPWEGYMHDNKMVLLQENANSVLLNSDMRGYNIELENTADYSFILDQNLDFITQGLSAKVTASFVSYFRNYIRRDKDVKMLAYWSPMANPDGTVSFYQAKEDVLPYNSVSQGKSRKEYYEFALNYKRTFNNDHSVSALALVNADKSHFTQNQWNSIPRAYLGVVGRVTYNYKNRYMAEYNIGYNGSENFAEGKRFGLFPAYSAGWTFTEESWLKNLIGDKILSYGKFRFSYGTVGNDRMRVGGSDIRFLYLPDSYTMNTNGAGGWYNNYGIRLGLPASHLNYLSALPGATGNPDVTWEKSTKINYGADLTFLGDKLTVKFDYFTEDRKDILINQQVVPVYQQTGTLALNLGQVKNKGYEIEVGWNKAINKDFRYSIDLNYTNSRNEVIEMDEPKQLYEYRQQTGRRVGEIWGFQQGDFFRTIEDAQAYKEELWQVYSSLNPGAVKSTYQAYKIFNAGSDVSAGDLKFIDRNGDGIIDNMDQGYLDTPNFPETMFGMKLGFKYKAWSVSAMLQGASDFSINTRTNYSPTPNRGSILDFVMNRYTPERFAAGEKVEYPRLVATNDNWSFAGSYWIKDATYLRLKNVELGYSFDSSKRFVKSIGIDNIRIFTNGMNLFTWTKIKYLDPETTNGELRYPRSKVINLGIQAQF